MQRGVPIFKKPALTLTPIIIGSCLLKTASLMISSTQGNIASPLPAFLRSSAHCLTYFVNSSNK